MYQDTDLFTEKLDKKYGSKTVKLVFVGDNETNLTIQSGNYN